jgi:hypothetical protein
MANSYLQTLIKAVRSEFKNTTPQLPTAITAFKQAITDKLKVLSAGNNLRIYDGQEGGVVRGPKRDRQTCENAESGNLLCQEKYFTDCKLEVPYFRSVFNSPAHQFTLNANPELIVRLIGYESPLMRSNRGKLSRAVSCDLVGLTSDSQVLCIEGKVKPHEAATDIVYGLLESFAYGMCVEYFLSEENYHASFCKEVGGCLSEFHPNACGFNEDKLTAAFTLAAPREYFAEYFNPTQNQKKTARAHRNLIKKVEGQLSEAKQILAAFKESERPAWAGFLIMEPPCSIESFNARSRRTVKEKTYVEPHFKSELFKVELAVDICTLNQKVVNKGNSI